MKAKSDSKAKPAPKKPAKPIAGELSGDELQTVTGGLSSTGGGGGVAAVCVSQLG